MEYITSVDYRHAKRVFKNYNKDKNSSYLMYLNANNLYEWAMSQRLPVDGLKWTKMHLNLIKNL